MQLLLISYLAKCFSQLNLLSYRLNHSIGMPRNRTCYRGSLSLSTCNQRSAFQLDQQGTQTKHQKRNNERKAVLNCQIVYNRQVKNKIRCDTVPAEFQRKRVTQGNKGDLAAGLECSLCLQTHRSLERFWSCASLHCCLAVSPFSSFFKYLCKRRLLIGR